MKKTKKTKPTNWVRETTKTSLCTFMVPADALFKEFVRHAKDGHEVEIVQQAIIAGALHAFMNQFGEDVVRDVIQTISKNLK
jgi:predicted small metal-binding protein